MTSKQKLLISLARRVIKKLARGVGSGLQIDAVRGRSPYFGAKPGTFVGSSAAGIGKSSTYNFHEFHTLS